MEEVAHTTTMAPRMAMVMGVGMEPMETRTALHRPHPPRGILAMSLVTSAGRLDIMLMNAQKLRMGTAMEAPGRSPTRSTKDK